MNSIRCRQCEHYIEANAGEGKIYGCDRSRCVFEPTTKNDCEHCSKTYGTLGCCDFVSNEPVYSCKEGHEEYARGIRKLGTTTKNNLGVDCISRAEAIKCLECDFDITGKENMKTVVNYINSAHDKIVNLPSVTSQFSSALDKNSKKLEKDFGELDCIDRAELLKAMDTWDKFGYTTRYGLERLHKDDKGFVAYVKYEDMVNCVKNMPPVTPQEPKIGYKVSGDLLGGLYCSECMTYVNEYFNYCPHCGAKMVKPQESEEKE